MQMLTYWTNETCYQEITKTLLVAGDRVGVQVNTVQTLYMFLSVDQHVRQVMIFREIINRQNLFCPSVKRTST